MPTRQQEHEQAKQDQAVEDSFPASDPPAASGIVGPGTDRRERPDDRHTTETAYQRKHEKAPRKR
jgi:hypothetical protein